MSPAERPLPPSVDALAALAVDDWAALLPTARAGLRTVADATRDPAAERLLAVPPGRLAGGTGRERLVALLVRPDVWAAVDAALGPDAPRPWREPGPPDEPAGPPPPDPAVMAERDALRERVADLEQRLRTARAERDAAREDAGRAERAAREAAGRAEEAAAARGQAKARSDEAARALEAAAEERERAVARARRREASAAAATKEELAAARREVDELRRALARARASSARQTPPTRDPAPGPPSAPREDDGMGRRARPSQLPADLDHGTTPATRWLLDGGVRVLVDGYNVTLTHRPGLDLAGQRRWLVEGLAALATRADVDVQVVFDARGGTSRRLRPRAGVTVRFTEPELSADDELVFEVEAMSADAPVVVVTDDRELRERLARHGVDLLHTALLLPLLG